MMTDVACFCGCLFSFDGATGGCPKCGEVASLMAGPALGSPGRNWPEHSVPVMHEIGQNGQPPGTCPELVEAGALSGIAVDAAARRPWTGRERRR
jgi:hypothetical protein